MFQKIIKKRPKLREVNDVGPLIKFGAVIALCVLLIPVFIVVLTGLNAGDHLTFPPEGLSTRWIIAFFKSEVFLSAFLFSFGLALITMVISTILGTMAAEAERKRKERGTIALWEGLCVTMTLS